MVGVAGRYRLLFALVTSACATARPTGPAAVRSTEHVRQGETRELEALLAGKEIDVNAADANGETLLMHAADVGRAAVAEILLAHGAALEQTDRLGKTALLHACTAGRPHTVSMLVNLGANIAATSTDGRDCAAWADPTRSNETHNSGSVMSAVQSAARSDSSDEGGRGPVGAT